MRKNLFFLLLLMLIAVLNTFGQSLKFNGTNSYINLTNDAALHLTSFTLEAWIKPAGTGVTTNTGTGGITAVPIIGKGRGEADAPASININYFLGIDKNKKLTADFEQSSGTNHPVVSNTAVKDSVWTHVAVSYEPVSAVCRLYINGVLDVTKDLGSNITPVNTSIQPATIATAINSTGTTAGYFKGNIDEVRIWKVVRTGAEILNNYKRELTSGTGLVARYGLNEGSGSTAVNSISTSSNGKLVNNPQWTTGFTLPVVSGFSSVSISSGWNQAVGLTFNKTGNQMFVWEKGGKVWVVENNQKKIFIDISPEVGNYSVMGLIGFALHPQFESNGYFYLLYTVDRHHLLYYGTSKYSSSANEYYKATIGRVTRYTAAKTSGGYRVDTLTRKVLLGATKSTGIPNLFNAHHVNSLVFGTDGTLLVSTGDGSTPSVTDTGSAQGTFYAQALADKIITSQENVGSFRSQLLQSYNGKILRIDPLTGNGISSNPFYETANPGSVRSKVWALGFRNPYRMAIRPGTGSSNPADGNPGVLYVGDVGWTECEEINVVKKPGMNFGWPLFEGLTRQSLFGSKLVYNYHAPNPLYSVNGCVQKYFYFKDLIKQETASGTATFTNPCNTSQGIPSNIKTFMHSRPVIDWKQGTGPSRTGTFSGETATVTNIGAAGSPVSGPQFGGACVIGGVFYTHDDFPAKYKNTYFFGDYVNRWIRSLAVDGSNKPVNVTNSVDSGSQMAALAIHPLENGIYYVNYGAEIRKIIYNAANHPPVAVASSDKKYGPSPLSVQFTGSASSDPDGQPLTYLWNFGDGTTSTLTNPSHTFKTATSAPAKFTVKLIVKDTEGGKDSATLIISANNTPPLVTITSPSDGTLYPLTGESRYDLRAAVTDKESIDGKLSYQWQTILHHEGHEHPDPADTSRITTATIDPLGCGTEIYYYRILLTVTDPGGLSTTREVRLYPYCSQRAGSLILVNADNGQDLKTLTSGETINLANLPTKNLNIRAKTIPSTVGSVKFKLTGTQSRNQTESTAPYVLFGDANGKYNPWTPSTGSYTLQATPYSASGGSGTVGSTLVIPFNVVNQSTAARIPVKSELEAKELNEAGFSVNYYPNPFENQFKLLIQKKGEYKLPVKMYDMHGRTVLQLTDVQARQTLVLGRELAPGMYVLQVGTGNKAKRFKLIKISR